MLKNNIWHRSYITISRNKLIHNLQYIKSLVNDNVKITLCVKGNAYGHGLIEISQIIESFDNQIWLCVQSAFEGKRIREAGINSPILIISEIFEDEFATILNYNLKTFISNPVLIDSLNQKAKSKNMIVDVIAHVDTGMNWQGLRYDSAIDTIKKIKNCQNLNLVGISSHFIESENTNSQNNLDQLDKFLKLKTNLENENIDIQYYQIANSSAVLTNQNSIFNMIQPGIIIYGYDILPNNHEDINSVNNVFEVSKTDFEEDKLESKILDDKKTNITNTNTSSKNELLPVLEFRTYISQIIEIKKGESIGYGSLFQAPRDMTVAILPIGYYDGYDKRFTNCGKVLVNDKICNVVGRICMNITMIDVTNLDCKQNDVVTLISSDQINNAKNLSRLIDTSPYELLTRLNESITRIVV
jgi:alanine racemase